MEKKLDTRLKLLAFINKSTQSILQQAKIKELENQTKRLEKIINEIDEIKLEIIEEKINNEEEEEAIDAWSEARNEVGWFQNKHR